MPTWNCETSVWQNELSEFGVFDSAHLNLKAQLEKPNKHIAKIISDFIGEKNTVIEIDILIKIL
jgi:hypothetical protein